MRIWRVVKNAMTKAGERLTILFTPTVTSSTTTSASQHSVLTDSEPRQRRGELRPWLQDFDLGATYTADMVRAQIQATYDSGLDSWMLWDPNNRYSPAALDK